MRARPKAIPRGYSLRFRRVVVLTVLALILTSNGIGIAVLAQQRSPVADLPAKALPDKIISKPRLFRSDVSMTLVPVTVTDEKDEPITDLRPSSFQLFENDIEQKIVTLAKEDGPVSVAFVVDTSTSMRNRIQKSITAIELFLKTMVPGDEFCLVRFSDRPTLVTGFTSDPNEIARKLYLTQPQGWTAVLDAIYLALHQMKLAKNPRRALFILTDGSDNSSRYSETDVKTLVMESDVRIYAVGLAEQPRFLEMLATETGGDAVVARKLENLPRAIAQISKDFRNQYLLSYYSQNQQKDGKYRKLKVLLPRDPAKMLRLSWRRGYYAPSD